MELDLAFIWAGLLAFAVFAYVTLDGFDLGIGILFPWLSPGAERDVAMNSVAPVWDGNETWLVLGGGGLFAAFPLAYAVVMPALYVPILAMLFGLVFRGVAFEFRWRDEAHRPAWDMAFALGSITATFSQGIVLGAFVQGIAVDNRAYSGGWWDWLTPFSLFTGLALLLGYSFLGACWLIGKSRGDLREKSYRFSRILMGAVMGLILAVSLWTPYLHPDIYARWFSWPNMLYLSPVPLLVGLLAVLLLRAFYLRHDRYIFPLALGVFLLCYIGLGISTYPYIVPRSLTIWQAAGPDSSLGFLLVGSLVLLPLILAYTAYAYWVFRGKVDEDGGYH